MGMMLPFLDSGAPPVRQAELIQRLQEYRVQGAPYVRRARRTTRGGGFGDLESRPHAWTIWFMVDGAWRQLESERGHPREWTSLDRVERWLREANFTSFVVADSAERK